MPRLRRAVQTFVAAWSFSMAGKVLGHVVGLDGAVAGVPPLVGLLVGTVVGLAASRNATPWTPQDLRDGAVGWGFVAFLIVPLITIALLPLDWMIPAGIASAILVVACAVAVRRRADEWGVPSAVGTDEVRA